MAVLTAVKNRKQSAGRMHAALAYTADLEKTRWKNRDLVTGFNCTAQHVFTEMMSTKALHKKLDGRMFYQFVQSFEDTPNLQPEEVHQMGLELAEKLFPTFEVLVATHCNTQHPHNHLIVNAVSFQTGKKFHQNHDVLVEQRRANDEICLAHGLDILQQYRKNQPSQNMTSREYQTAMKGESYKFRLMNTIDQCMEQSQTKDDFITLMGYEGYDVCWQEGHKYITYTTPEGKKCRDKKLHDKKYTKEKMEHELRIRQQIIDRNHETAQSPRPHRSPRSTASGGLGREELAGFDRSGTQNVGTATENFRPADDPRASIQLSDLAGVHDKGTPLGATEYRGGDGPTGWEAERGMFFHREEHGKIVVPNARKSEQPNQSGSGAHRRTSPQVHRSHYHCRGTFSNILNSMRPLFSEMNPSPTALGYQNLDRKAYRKLMEKRRTMGIKGKATQEMELGGY